MRGSNLENAALLAAHDLETAQQKVQALEADIEQARIDPYIKEAHIKDQMEETSRTFTAIQEYYKTSRELNEARSKPYTPEKSGEIQQLMKDQSALRAALERQITKTIQRYENTNPKPAAIEYFMKEQQSRGSVIKDFEDVLKWENRELTKQLSMVERDKLVWPKEASGRLGFVSPTIAKLEAELVTAQKQITLAQQAKEDVALITAVIRAPEVAPDGQLRTTEEMAQVAKAVRSAAERAKQNEGVKAIAMAAADKADKIPGVAKFKQEDTFLENMRQEREAELGKLKIADKGEKVGVLRKHFTFEKMRQERQAELNELRTVDKGGKIREKVGVLDKQLGKHFKDKMTVEATKAAEVTEAIKADKDFLAKVFGLALGQVVYFAGTNGKEFYKDQEKLSDARSLVMNVVLAEISQKTGMSLQKYADRGETILLDTQDIRKIEKLVDKAIMQTVKELNEHVDTIDRLSNPGRNRKEELRQDTYSEYLREAAAVTQKKFEADLSKDHSKETRATSGGLVNSFKAAVRKIFSSTPVTQISSFDSIVSTTVKAGQTHADKAAQPKLPKRSFTDRVKKALPTRKHTEKLAQSQQDNQGQGSQRG